MKKEISSIELRRIIIEMQFLEHARLDRIIQKERELFLQFFASGKGNFTIKVVPGKYFYLTGQKSPMHEPHNFVMRLRKYVPCFFLRSVTQLGSERVVEMILEKNEQEYKMYVELFGRGNVVLCDSNDVIIAVLDREKLEDKAQKEIKYIPPKKGKNLFTLGMDGFMAIKDSRQESLVKALAIEFSIGGVYAEEVCSISGMDKKTKPSGLSRDDVEKLFNSLQDVLSRRTEPQIVYKEGAPMNVVPFSLAIYGGLESRRFATFNESLDFAIETYFDAAEHEEVKEQANMNTIKTQRIIDEQQKGLVEIRKTVEENQRKGEFIYERYAVIKEILDEMNKARAKYSLKEIKEKLKGHKVIKSVNEKEKKIVVEI